MKSNDEVKAFFRGAAIDTNPDRDEAVLAEALQAGGLKYVKHAAGNGPRIWRFLMRSPITKLTAAGLVIAAVVIGVSHLNGTVVKAVEFSEITEAMGQVPWMHASSSGFERGITGVGEQWIGFQAKIHAGRSADGKVSFWNLREHQRTEYDPGRNAITLAYMQDDEFPLNLSSPAQLLESMNKMFMDQGAEIVARIGEYQGCKAQVQTISLSNVGTNGESQTLTLYVDPDSKRLYAAEVKGIDSQGEVTMAGTMTFDYPESGPESIYDLGVPQDAQILSNMPGRNVHSIREHYRQVRGETSLEYGVMQRYWQIRDEATQEYIAVIAHNTGVAITDVVNMVDVDYKSGNKHRQERHGVFYQGQPVDDEVWAKSKQKLGNTLESLLAWSRGHDAGRGRIDIHLYDGQYDCSVSRDRDNWGQPTKHYHPEGSVAPEIALGDLAWPEVLPGARIAEDDYATERGLICFEHLQQGRVSNGAVHLPGRFLWYLDPAWDYLCRRKVTEWRRDADWQEDKDWLKGVDPSKVPDSTTTIEEITEAFQSPNGHWYPTAIVVGSGSKGSNQGSLKAYHIKRIYLDLNPEFPEGIFDVDKLPGQ